jgi:RNA polymerase sigma-70 factor, ECF subfamily
MNSHPTLNSNQPSQTKKEMFTEIYKEYRFLIFNYIFYRVGDHHLADDLTSDVFVRMVDKYDHKARKGRPLAPWLYTIARNLVIDYHRRKGLISWQPLHENFTVEENEAPDKQIEKHLTHECLAKVMKELTEDQRRVILLKFIERRTNREVSELLGKPEGAIKSLQHRALASLRRILEKESCYDA